MADTDLLFLIHFGACGNFRTMTRCPQFGDIFVIPPKAVLIFVYRDA
jgi:hypothetical protein